MHRLNVAPIERSDVGVGPATFRRVTAHSHRVAPIRSVEGRLRSNLGGDVDLVDGAVVTMIIVEVKWVATFTCVVVVVGCGHDAGSVDTARRFVGEWVCDAGERELQCGGVVSVVDLASGFPDVVRFRRGTQTDLVLTAPSRVLVPGLPGGPTCDFELNSPNGDQASAPVESTCVDESGETIVVHRVSADVPWHQLLLETSATSADCHVENAARCWKQLAE